MPAASDSVLAYAGYLRSLPDADLVALLAARELRESSIKDFFDLADALLDPASVQQALTRLDRPTLAALAAGTGSAAAVRVGLATPDAVPAAVTRQLRSWPSLGLPSPSELADEPAPTPLAPVGDIDQRFTDTVAAERAFGTTTSAVELVAELQHEPARELARGGIALPDSRRLAAAMGIDNDDVPVHFEIASRAGLVAFDSGRWLPTAASTPWLLDGWGARWAALAEAWLERLPHDIREILARSAHAAWGERLHDYADWLYPAGGEWMRERVLAYTRDAELLGITAHHQPSSPGVALLSAGPAAAAEAMAALFPAEIDKVYLQPDLSVVSPGPLRPALDSRLRGIADVEARGIASTYRVSTASVNRAMAAGESEESIREFLASISLTGIPQPLSYLLAEAAARYGLVRVGALDGDRSYVRSTDDTLLRTLLVDVRLTALGLTRAGERLISRFDQDLVFWSLAEARYPVAAENADREIIVLERPRATRSAPVATDATASLIERLRLGSAAESEDTGAAWLARQLDVAIKGRLALTVTIRMPDGTDVDYQLEPASIAGGRLRARDRRADIERTLPLASIVSVGPAH